MKIFSENKSKKSPGGKQSVGFYIAVAVCLLLIGGASLTTVSSIRSLFTESASSTDETSSTESSVQVEVTVSGVTSSTPNTSSQPPITSKPSETTSIPSSAPSSAPESSVEANRPISPNTSSAPSETPSSKPEETPSSKPADDDFKVDSTTFIMPVPGKVLKTYSDSVYSMTFCDWRAHYGVDLVATQGSNVLSIGDGTVKNFYWDDMLGYILVVEYGGGIEVSYCGLSDSPTVKAGAKVKCGQVLGIVYNIPSESVEEHHLHLEVRVNGELTEPLSAIGKSDKLPSEEN